MKRLFIIHGYNAYPEKHWFPWLKEQFPHIPTEIIKLPNAHAPQLEDWLAAINEAVGEADEGTYIVAHSLGTQTTLHYAMQQQTLGGIILVSGFAEKIPHLAELDNFALPINDTHIKTIVAKRTIIAAKDDSIVPFSCSERLAKRIDATFITQETGNHFMQSDGFTTLPIVVKALEEMW